MAEEANIIVALYKSEGEENCLSFFSTDKTEIHKQMGLRQYVSNILVVGKLLSLF
jgi:hypothetical protein